MLLFCICAGLITYIVIGYPILLSGLARWRKCRVETGDDLRSVSIVVPVHNGGRFLYRKLQSLLALNYPKELVGILVISDGSTDETEEVAGAFFSQGVALISIPRGGKAAALNAAALRVSGEILVLTDVRQELEPDSLRYLLQPFRDPAVGVVSGELVLRSGTSRDETDVGLYWRYESWIRRNLSAVDSMFGATGPFYAMRRHLFTPIPEDVLLDDVYLPMTAFFRGCRLIVEPRAIAYDYPMTRKREFDRKVRTLGGNYQLLLRMPQLLGLSNRLLWHFLSYKIGRLFLPWLAILTFVSSLALPRPWNWLVFGAQALLLLCALFDSRISQRNILKRISSPARTFTVLMAATLKGLQVLFVPPRKLWKVTDIASDS